MHFYCVIAQYIILARYLMYGWCAVKFCEITFLLFCYLSGSLIYCQRSPLNYIHFMSSQGLHTQQMWPLFVWFEDSEPTPPMPPAFRVLVKIRKGVKMNSPVIKENTCQLIFQLPNPHKQGWEVGSISQLRTLCLPKLISTLPEG